MKILVVEDEIQLNTIIRDYLETLGWQTLEAASGHQALELFHQEEPDFLLLDIMIPTLDGMDVMRRIRETSSVPIILITAKTEESDKLMGLELGADDYILKPFSLKELAARIRAILRRVRGSEDFDSQTLKVGRLELEPQRRRVTLSGESLDLTQVQFDILYGFMRHPGRVFTRVEILGFFQEHVWEGYERTIDVHVKNIRKVLEPDRKHPRFIETVRGVGYRLIEEADT